MKRILMVYDLNLLKQYLSWKVVCTKDRLPVLERRNEGHSDHMTSMSDQM